MLDLRSHITESWSHLAEKKLFIACSGGVDSIVLLHLLHAQKFAISVIHVNYQLRGEDSDLDAKCVETNCEELGIPCEIRTVDLAKQLANGGNLQEIARNIRYTWFQEILLSDPQNCILLAHHADDQVETFFMNLARKSGVMGMACMPSERGRIYRPLLKFRKQELIHYAERAALKWREDQSNASLKYRRNKLRNELLPRLRQDIPSIDESTLLLIEHFQALQRKLESTVHPLATKIKDDQALPFEVYQKLDELEKIELFRQLGISSKIVERTERLLSNAKGKKISLDHPTFDSIVRDHAQFSFVQKKSTHFFLQQELVDSLPSQFSKNEIYLDASKIEGDLKLRTWQLNDRIASLGMKGTQLISDVIKSSKINAQQKQEVLVLHDAAAIHWCVGLKIGRLALASADSKEIVRCSVSAQESQE